jgi:hypothetical protein
MKTLNLMVEIWIEERCSAIEKVPGNSHHEIQVSKALQNTRYKEKSNRQ